MTATGVFASFVGGILTAQAFVTNFTDQRYAVEVQLRDSGGTTVASTEFDLDPVLDPTPVDNFPIVSTFIKIAPGVYSGWINYAVEAPGASSTGWNLVTSGIYVAGPVPISPVGTHGRLMPAHPPARTPTR